MTADEIRTLRAQLGLSQSQFAKELGCATVTVRKWEHGTRSPTGLYAQAVERLRRKADRIMRENTKPP